MARRVAADQNSYVSQETLSQHTNPKMGQMTKEESLEVHTQKKLKGIKKHIVQKHITFDDYKKCIFPQVIFTRGLQDIPTTRYLEGET